jgi:hypothetical protein
MGHLTVITETGMFHSACMLEIGTWGRREWRGFHPRKHRVPAGHGEIDTSNREAYINHYVRFEVPDEKLQAALALVDFDWRGSFYVIGVQDCVSYSSDLARACGLWVPPPPIMMPYELLAAMRNLNTYTHFDTVPYPWLSGG